MAQQSSREFASTDPTTRIQDAGFQVSGISPKISLNSRSHLQHVQRPTSSHFCKDAPSISCVGYEHVARGSRGRLKNIRDAEFSCSYFNDVTTPSLRIFTHLVARALGFVRWQEDREAVERELKAFREGQVKLSPLLGRAAGS